MPFGAAVGALHQGVILCTGFGPRREPCPPSPGSSTPRLPESLLESSLCILEDGAKSAGAYSHSRFAVSACTCPDLEIPIPQTVYHENCLTMVQDLHMAISTWVADKVSLSWQRTKRPRRSPVPNWPYIWHLKCLDGTCTVVTASAAVVRFEPELDQSSVHKSGLQLELNVMFGPRFRCACILPEAETFTQIRKFLVIALGDYVILVIE
jgi:hypothetical protein